MMSTWRTLLTSSKVVNEVLMDKMWKTEDISSGTVSQESNLQRTRGRISISKGLCFIDRNDIWQCWMSWGNFLKSMEHCIVLASSLLRFTVPSEDTLNTLLYMFMSVSQKLHVPFSLEILISQKKTAKIKDKVVNEQMDLSQPQNKQLCPWRFSTQIYAHFVWNPPLSLNSPTGKNMRFTVVLFSTNGGNCNLVSFHSITNPYLTVKEELNSEMSKIESIATVNMMGRGPSWGGMK